MTEEEYFIRNTEIRDRRQTAYQKILSRDRASEADWAEVHKIDDELMNLREEYLHGSGKE